MARLQKKDLANEFSDIVKQEIKNHNDSILATNVAINEIVENIRELKTTSDKKREILHNNLAAHIADFYILQDKIENDIKTLKREYNDFSLDNKKNLILIKKSLDDRETYYVTVVGFDQFKQKIEQWAANLQRAFQVQQDSFRQRIDKLIESSCSAIESARKSLQKNIDSETESRRQQDQTLDHFAVNFSGLQKEIEVLKKRCFVIEKNNENIYTQIDRLKATK